MSQYKAQSLEPTQLLNAYAQGMFPMPNRYGNIKWYAPDPRAILEHRHLHVSRSLRATIRKGIYEIRTDTSFEAVMRNCAAREKTWINEEFIKAYTCLHRHGFAHSVEAWHNENLVGGLYGISIGGAFMGESMFSHKTDASKVCLVAAVEHLMERGYVLHDTQFVTPHLTTMGVTSVSRTVYEQRLQKAISLPCSWFSTNQR